jgi:hypothetical protein
VPAIMMAAAAALVWNTAVAGQQAVSAPQRLKGDVIRGCLAGSKLTHTDSENETLQLPDTLVVRSIPAIRDQVKRLSGHTVEVIGRLRGVPGQETGQLIVDSDDVKVYLGGGDARLGWDVAPPASEWATIHAHTIKDVADRCAMNQPK